jgi:hypothetical protein
MPQQAAEDCKLILMISRFDNPKVDLLFKNYPMLSNKPMITLKEVSARQLVSDSGAFNPQKPDRLITPSAGMTTLLFMMQQKMHDYYDIECVGFTWDGEFATFQEHHQDIEQKIQKQWASDGYLTFI